MTKSKTSKRPIPPGVSVLLLAGMLALAFLSVAIGSIAPIDFVYDGI